MRILIVTQYFWPENFRINDLARSLLESGHLITVLTGIPNYPTGRFFSGYGWFKQLRQDHAGIKIVRVPHISRGNAGNLRLMLNYFSFAFFASFLGPFLCPGKFDLIFVYQPSPITVGLPAIIFKKLKRAPIMFWVLDLWPESLSATGAVTSLTILKGVRTLVRFIYRQCDRILVQSPEFIKPINATGVDLHKISYFPSWAEAIFQPTTKSSDVVDPVLADGFRLMFAGNVGAAQDFDTILSAAELLKDEPNIYWLIVGDGRKLDWVREQVRRRALSHTVHLLGRHPLEAMPQFFSQADAMLVSLKSEPIFSLTIPAKIQSYLAYGKPIVAALDGVGGRIVEEAQAGLTCPAGDPRALADTVVSMYRLPISKRNAMGIHGKAYYAENFERGMLLDRIQRWMQELTVKSKISVR